jgi:hypothetical protein
VAEETKEYIFEKIFNDRWDPNTATLSNPIVLVNEILETIRHWNEAHPTKEPKKIGNPYAFFKDFARNKKSANRRWPRSILARNYTARQLTGSGASFEFVPLEPGQTVPFTNIVPPPAPSTETHRIESVSLPLTSRLLGRGDEPWLIQVLVRLHVIETHLSLYSTRNILQIDHLQMNVKLHLTEIDALFLAIEQVSPGVTQEVIVNCEAKGLSDDIIESQVISQAQSVFQSQSIHQDIVIPMAVKPLRQSVVHVVEFDAISRGTAPSTTALTIASDALYEFIPPVPGIGEKKTATARKPHLKKLFE